MYRSSLTPRPARLLYDESIENDTHHHLATEYPLATNSKHILAPSSATKLRANTPLTPCLHQSLFKKPNTTNSKTVKAPITPTPIRKLKLGPPGSARSLNKTHKPTPMRSSLLNPPSRFAFNQTGLGPSLSPAMVSECHAARRDDLLPAGRPTRASLQTTELFDPDDHYPGVERPPGLATEYCPKSNGFADMPEDCDDLLMYPIDMTVVSMPELKIEPPPMPGWGSCSSDDQGRSCLSPVVTKTHVFPALGPLRAAHVVDLDYDWTAWSLEEGSSDDEGLMLKHADRDIFRTLEHVGGQLVFE